MMTRPTSISVMQWAEVFNFGSNHDPEDYLPKDLSSKILNYFVMLNFSRNKKK